METRYDYKDLIRFAIELLRRSGVDQSIAKDVGEVLVEGDLLGKSTHGLQLLGPYLKCIQAGEMTLSGAPSVVKDCGGNLTLDADYLPGPFVVRRAIQEAEEKVRTYGVATVAIQRSHHIACLQAYLKPVTDKGFAIILACSDPSVKTVSAFGGVKPVFTPNPFALGIPTESDPILIDISASTTTNGRSMQLHKRGETFSSDCLLSADGEPTNDPAVLFKDPPGTILPLGGMDFGHKGFSLAILVEMLTSGLGGHGRSNEPKRWGASIFLQLMDPGSFGGTEHFKHEMELLAHSCRASGKDGQAKPVRMPGENALALRARQMKEGITLYPAIMPSLEKWAGQLKVALPEEATLRGS